ARIPQSTARGGNTAFLATLLSRYCAGCGGPFLLSLRQLGMLLSTWREPTVVACPYEDCRRPLEADVTRRVEDQLGAIVQALHAFQSRLTAVEHVQILRVAANASAALGDRDFWRIERSLQEMGDAAAILSRAGDR